MGGNLGTHPSRCAPSPSLPPWQLRDSHRLLLARLSSDWSHAQHLAASSRLISRTSLLASTSTFGWRFTHRSTEANIRVEARHLTRTSPSQLAKLAKKLCLPPCRPLRAWRVFGYLDLQQWH